jgi:hypothetical protein
MRVALAVAVDVMRTRARHGDWFEADLSRRWADAAELPVVDVEPEVVPDLPAFEWPKLDVPTLVYRDGALDWDSAWPTPTAAAST